MLSGKRAIESYLLSSKGMTPQSNAAIWKQVIRGRYFLLTMTKQIPAQVSLYWSAWWNETFKRKQNLLWKPDKIMRQQKTVKFMR